MVGIFNSISQKKAQRFIGANGLSEVVKKVSCVPSLSTASSYTSYGDSSDLQCGWWVNKELSICHWMLFPGPHEFSCTQKWLAWSKSVPWADTEWAWTIISECLWPILRKMELHFIRVLWKMEHSADQVILVFCKFPWDGCQEVPQPFGEQVKWLTSKCGVCNQSPDGQSLQSDGELPGHSES